VNKRCLLPIAETQRQHKHSYIINIYANISYIAGSLAILKDSGLMFLFTNN